MLNRLKNSLAAAALSTVVMLGLSAVADRPAAGAAALPTTAVIEVASVTAEQAAEQLAYTLAVQLTALAIDAALQQESRATAPASVRTEKAASATPSLRRDLRMPFYSFASRLTRARES